jgi:hypothetical protein
VESTPHPEERFPSRYGRSLADLLAGLLRDGDGTRVVDRELIRILWRRRYPEMAAASRDRPTPGRRCNTSGAKTGGTLNQAYRALEQANVAVRRACTVNVVDVRALVQIAHQYTGSDAAFSRYWATGQGADVDKQVEIEARAELVEFPEKDGRWSLQGQHPAGVGYQLNGTLDEIAEMVSDMQNALKKHGAVTTVLLRAEELTIVTTTDPVDGTERIYLGDSGEEAIVSGTPEEIEQFRESIGTQID